MCIFILKSVFCAFNTMCYWIWKVSRFVSVQCWVVMEYESGGTCYLLHSLGKLTQRSSKIRPASFHSNFSCHQLQKWIQEYNVTVRRATGEFKAVSEHPYLLYTRRKAVCQRISISQLSVFIKQEARNTLITYCFR